MLYLTSIPQSRKGVALITVLSLIALITVTIVAFFAIVSEDRQRAREYLDYSKSTMLVESAFQEALGKIIEGSEIPWATSPDGEVVGASMTASPGLMEIRYYREDPNRGSGGAHSGTQLFTNPDSFVRNPFAKEYNGQLANPRWIPLFSWQRFGPGLPFLDSNLSQENPDYNPAAIFNLNTAFNPFFPGELYLSGTPEESFATKILQPGFTENPLWPNPDTAREERFFQRGESSYDRPFYVQWVPVLADPTREPSVDNQLVGRYAYWVDVENTKVHLNVNTRSLQDDREGGEVGKNISTFAAILGHPMGDAYNGLPMGDSATFRAGVPEWEGSEGLSYFSQQPFPQSNVNAIINSSFNNARRQLTDGLPMTQTAEFEGWNTSFLGNQGSFYVLDSDAGFRLDPLGGTNEAHVRSFDYLLGWSARLNGDDSWGGFHDEEDNLPFVADNSIVDWNVFTGKRPLHDGFALEMAMETFTLDYSRSALDLDPSPANRSYPRGGRFNSITEMYSLIDPLGSRRNDDGSPQFPFPPDPSKTMSDAYMQAFRRTHGMSATIYGYEEERDPLGLPKIDIVRLQREGTGGQMANQLRDRLNDPAYHFAYFPGRGTPYMSNDSGGRSFAQSLNSFAGDGRRDNDNNGLAVVEQMIANIVSYAEPHDTPPSFDESLGVVPVKSVPHVAEVGTRARNSLWGLAEENEPLVYVSPYDTDASTSPDSDSTINEDAFYRPWGLFQADRSPNPEPIEDPDPESDDIVAYRYHLEFIRDWGPEDGPTGSHSLLVPNEPESDHSLENWSLNPGSGIASFYIEVDNPNENWDLAKEGFESTYSYSPAAIANFLNNTANREGSGSGTLPLGSNLEAYFRNIMVDVIFGMANPNPFASNRFEGNLVVNTDSGDLTFMDSEGELSEGEGPILPDFGPYAMRPAGGASRGRPSNYNLIATGYWARGETLFARLGGTEGYELIDFSNESNRWGNSVPLRINGWEIQDRNGEVFHRVPMRSLGAPSSTVVPWWDMTNTAYNVGAISLSGRGDQPINSWNNSFKPFQERRLLESNAEVESDAVPVGWFSYETQRHRWDDEHDNILSIRANLEEAVDDGILNWLQGVVADGDDTEGMVINTFIGRDVLENISSFNNALVLVNANVDEDGDVVFSSPGSASTIGEPGADLTHWGALNREFLRNVRQRPPMMEVVLSIDPVLGHRTINPDLEVNSDFGNLSSSQRRTGHFYGTLGHTWRRASPYLQVEEPIAGGPREERPIIDYTTEEREREIQKVVVRGTRYETITVTVTETVEVPILGDPIEIIDPPQPGGFSLRIPHVMSRPYFGVVYTGGDRRQGMSARTVPPSLVGPVRQQHVNHLSLWDYEFLLDSTDRSSVLNREVDGVGLLIPLQASAPQVRRRSFFSSGVRGDYMVSIGELGFVHSGLPQLPINLGGITPQFTFLHGNIGVSNWASRDGFNNMGFGQNALEAPQNGPPMSMLLDLFTPGSFRDSFTGQARSQSDWENSGRSDVPSNSPLNPRRGTWNVNIASVGDNYMAFKQGVPNAPIDRTRHTLTNSPSWAVWVPSGMGFQAGEVDGRAFMLDPWMNYFPRYRRGFENWIAATGGDFTPDRSRGIGVWGNLHDSAARTYAYGPLNLPIYSFYGLDGGPPVGIMFDEWNSASDRSNPLALLMGAGMTIGGHSLEAFSGHIWMDSVFSYHGNHITGSRHDTSNASEYFEDALNAPRPENRLPLERITRFSLYPMRHHVSELNRSALDSIRDRTEDDNQHAVDASQFGGGRGAEFGFSYHKTIMNAERGYTFERLTFLSNESEARGAVQRTNPAGESFQAGVFRNTPYAAAANQVSTSANVFTIHIVAQAIRDSGENDQENGELNNWGDFSFSDQILSEQWARAVVARVPNEDTLSRYAGGNFANPEYDYKILYYRVVDNPR
ncbi:MAG: hypothetical protein LAT55_08935 [Opitutales bacterium]|nr:hypothetical protein [Opitutales bacterium]